MKYRDSGMPEVKMWETFFDPLKVLEKMEINASVNSYLDIGCGYGTFLFPASDLVKNAIGFDIDKNMIDHCKNIQIKLNIKNIELILGDISSENKVHPLAQFNNTIDYVSLFNILHCEEPVNLLEVARNLLNDEGKICVIHWQYKETPRGPAMEIRPRPEQIIEWAKIAKLNFTSIIDLPPYHYGLIFMKKEANIVKLGIISETYV